MIQGFFIQSIEHTEANETNYRGIFTVFVETDDKKHRTVICENAIYQFINCDQGIAVIIGSHLERTIIVVFSNLEGFEVYQNFVAAYLYSPHLTMETCCQNISDILQNENSVATVFLSEPSKSFYISSLPSITKADVAILPMLEKEYFIRDYAISVSNDEEYQEAFRQWKSLQKESYVVASDVSERILAQIEGFPRPVGNVISIFKSDGDSALINIPIDKKRKKEIQKPKNPVTAFNFYSSVNRQAVAMEYHNTLPNNDLNTELGRRWNLLSDAEKEPYLSMASEDKKRFKKDLNRMRKRSGAKDPPLAKPLTAYNHFVHQEKQFIVGLSLRNAQTRTGRHGGDRWSTMHPDEKHIYQILREAEVQEYENQF